VPDASAAALHLSRLTLQDFRNYRRLSLDLEPGAVVLTGENGAGKTNLLEAVSFLSPGRGLRRAPYADVARVGGTTGFAVHARLETPHGPIEVGTGTIGAGVAADGPDGEGIVRKVRVNGAPARGADALLDILRVVWLTPAMDALFTGPAAERRRFLDRLTLAIDPAHGQRALAYEKAMRGRNRLFAEGSRDRAFFEAIETQMAETGTAIAAARVELVRLLEAMIGRLPSDGPFPQSGIALAGVLEAEVAARPAVDVEEDFRRALAADRERERQAGRTLHGPHRSDLLVTHTPKAMPAELCSTGEQKALLIGLVLSHARLVGEIAGAAPVLLLDEVAAHLDSGRRAALFGILHELGCHSFMTGTEASLFASLKGRAQFLKVSDGTVRPLPEGVLAGL